ncbi:hypothetical protein M427DRAFT_299997 [Gonapodya prolifera JEL478]|uniref:Uncharacterized protein n=1 Tax=Gonapodya prolifera (strain JEL478) TaxID=1344416 RepID=A0A138ZWF7_GONPJ|nr:hypothetical protein M427DRAFT_299997 [Gonapodya prolifera JEL478]|eukprot:KXS08801.1 hypothetical protein M427DRAFT_299997 [Gonapodya prolifera JEL478]
MYSSTPFTQPRHHRSFQVYNPVHQPNLLPLNGRPVVHRIAMGLPHKNLSVCNPSPPGLGQATTTRKCPPYDDSIRCTQYLWLPVHHLRSNHSLPENLNRHHGSSWFQHRQSETHPFPQTLIQASKRSSPGRKGRDRATASAETDIGRFPVHRLGEKRQPPVKRATGTTALPGSSFGTP